MAGLLGGLVLGILPILPAAPLPQVHLTTTPVAAGPWLNRLNTWRASSGLPNLSENAVWSAGDYNHSLYMVKNDEVAHSEISTHPYYTAAGDAAARNSNIEVSGSTSTTDSQAIDWWMAAPFHAMSMMDPLLASTGFGAYRQVKSGWQAGFALDVSRGRLTSGGTYPMFFPGNGATEPLRSFGGGEFPNPLQACSGYTAPTGLPVLIEVGSNVPTTAGAVHSFTGNGVALQHCVIDSRNAALGASLKWHGGVILIPKLPLQNGVQYSVALTVNGVPYTWSFTVGATLLPPLAITRVSPNKGPLAGGTSVTINGTGFATGVTGVMFGATPAAGFSLVNDTTVSAVSPAHAAGAVDVTVTTAAGTTNISPADQYTFGACTSATASAAPASPSMVGTPVAVTVTSAGCANPLYEFWLMPPNGTWQMVQPFGGDTWNWDTSTYAPGTYAIRVWANNTGDSQASYETFGSLTYAVVLNACTSAGLTVTGLSSPPAGSSVAFAATSSVCTNPQYAFWIRSLSGTWYLKRPFNTDPTFDWSSAGFPPGTYLVRVWANQVPSTTRYDTFAQTSVTLTGCISATLAPASGSASVATPVQFSANAIGCSSPAHEFWVQDTVGKWHQMTGFGGPTWTWNHVGWAKGVYHIRVWANTMGSYDGTYQTFGSSTFTLT